MRFVDVLVAETCGVSVRSVETSPEWASRVGRLLGSRGEVVAVDLCPMGDWGRPVSHRFREPTKKIFEAVYV